jgi:hypothetical protein
MKPHTCFYCGYYFEVGEVCMEPQDFYPTCKDCRKKQKYIDTQKELVKKFSVEYISRIQT